MRTFKITAQQEVGPGRIAKLFKAADKAAAIKLASRELAAHSYYVLSAEEVP